ncbi:hypothetical protein BDV98DRAFT_381767 [Pterulicium gracile]|uniref:Uncharacterized protein n=1 Tax=Pterulicium gracile TaxID=1884261 RepID=A0A5C3QST6_9AGAR|nr:hypothetical protein BDV98DRAFT_381767 [Pterula gracilis]
MYVSCLFLTLFEIVNTTRLFNPSPYFCYFESMSHIFKALRSTTINVHGSTWSKRQMMATTASLGILIQMRSLMCICVKSSGVIHNLVAKLEE